MQRLLSLKLTSSNLSRKCTQNTNSQFLQSHHSEYFTSLTKIKHQRSQCHTVGPSLTSPTHRFYSFLSSNSSFSRKFHSFPSIPLRLKFFLSNSSKTHFGILNRSVTDCKVGFYRVRFPRGYSFGSYGRHWRSWFNQLGSNEVVLGLIIANVAVFLLWRIADQRFMMRNFMISVDNIKSGHFHTLITSAFSHIDVEHIISNMVGLYFFGTNIARNFGPEYLLKLYLAGAIGGSVFYLVHHAFMAASSKGQGMWTRDPSRTPGLGASGAVNAIMLLDIFLNPGATLYFDFIIPVPAMLLGIFLIGKDILRIIEGNSNISGSAHLGGAAVAAIAWNRIRKGRF
ncbi:hypothetical protein K2173_028335 [Erythroxylum novogranatense]|uniref:Peptidase S54 rhomboid domain-containing protein n=1 Tax=Erythroxylum novogranatense TaxID=1862640 RepID=A0AAV8U1U2_9ROSI|nr:hypothetical protein K2173_028335 [Erythroxylum novogranatense]